MPRSLRLKFYSYVTVAAVGLATAASANAADPWNPAGEYDLYIRNNTTKTYYMDSLEKMVAGSKIRIQYQEYPF
jgi:hypothetical protein